MTTVNTSLWFGNCASPAHVTDMKLLSTYSLSASQCAYTIAQAKRSNVKTQMYSSYILTEAVRLSGQQVGLAIQQSRVRSTLTTNWICFTVAASSNPRPRL